MASYSFPERDKLEELIDKWFPKGKCQERGQALMVNAEFVIWLGKKKKLPEFIDLENKKRKKK